MCSLVGVLRGPVFVGVVVCYGGSDKKACVFFGGSAKRACVFFGGSACVSYGGRFRAKSHAAR